MRPSRVVLGVWFALVAILLIVEVAEITHVFTLPIQVAVGDPLTFVFVLFFTTTVALVGAIFIGIFISSRMMRPTGFTPFEEEMLRMRGELTELKRSVDQIRSAVAPATPPDPAPEPPDED